MENTDNKYHFDYYFDYHNEQYGLSPFQRGEPMLKYIINRGFFKDFKKMLEDPNLNINELDKEGKTVVEWLKEKNDLRSNKYLDVINESQRVNIKPAKR